MQSTVRLEVVRACGSGRTWRSRTFSCGLCGTADNRYVHQVILGRSSLLSQPRVRLAWAIVLARHPLLAARIRARSYTQTSFLHCSPSSIDLALARADQQLTYLPECDEELVDAFLHGPRTLNADTSAVLVVRALPHAQPLADGERLRSGERLYELLLCAAPYASTPSGLHAVMGELHALLRTRNLTALLLHELANPAPFPTALDASPLTKFQLAVGAVLYAHDSSGPGGQAFHHSPSPNRTPQVFEREFDHRTTDRIHARCKQHGTEFVHVLVFLAAAAFAHQVSERQMPTRIELPTPYTSPIPAPASPTPSLSSSSSTSEEEVSNPVLIHQFTHRGQDNIWRKAAALTRREKREHKSYRRLSKFAAAAKAEVQECIRAAQREDENNSGLGLVGFTMPNRPAPVPEECFEESSGSDVSTPMDVQVEMGFSSKDFSIHTSGTSGGAASRGAASSGDGSGSAATGKGKGRRRALPLLGIQNLGALDDLYAPDIEGLVDGLQVRRMATGKRRSGVLLYYFEFGGRITLSVSADVGYDLDSWWEELGELVDEMFARPEEPPPVLERDWTGEPPAVLERDWT